MDERHHIATHHYNLGVQLENEGDFEKARAEFERALKEDPKFPYPYRALGELQYREGDVESAHANLSNALKLDPDWIEVTALLARIEYERGAYGRALELQEKALKHDPKNFDYNILLGKILSAQKRYSDSIQCLESLLEIHPEAADVHYNLGIAYGKRAHADLDVSVAHWQAACRFSPGDPHAYRNLGIALFSKGALNEAAAAFARALELDPGDAVASRFLKYAEGVR